MDNHILSRQARKSTKNMENAPYWDNTAELIGGLVEEEDEDAKDEKGHPLKGLALLKKIYGSSNQEQKGGKRTAKEIKKFIEASYNEKNPPKEIEGFLLDTELSNKTAKVYHNPTTGETVIAHRGTQGITDWGNNLAYVTGNYEKTDRYKKGKKNQKKAEEKYGAENISTLGHSQGAIIARKTGKNTKEIIGVNPASMGEKPLENEYNVRTSNDLVSMMLPSGKSVTTIKSKTSNPLTEHSAKNLKQIKNQEIGAGIKISYNDMNQLKGGRRRALNYSANDIDWFNDGLLDDDDEMFGGDIFKDISKGAKSLGKKISKGTKSVVKKTGAIAKKGYQTINKTALKQDWGGYIETVKEPLLEVLEPAMSAAMETAGVPAPVADTISASAVGSAKAVNFGKSLKGQGQKALTGAIKGAISGAVGSMTGGDPEEGAGRRRRRKIGGGAGASANNLPLPNITDDEIEDLISDDFDASQIDINFAKEFLLNRMRTDQRLIREWEKWRVGDFFSCNTVCETRDEIIDRLLEGNMDLETPPNTARDTTLITNAGSRKSQIVAAMAAKKLIDLQKMKNPSKYLQKKYGHVELEEAHPSGEAKAKMVIAPKKKYVRPQRGVKGARGKRGSQKKDKMTVEEQQASRKATLAKERAKTISLSSEIRDVVKAIPAMNYLELVALKPTLIRFNNAERTKAEDNNLEKLKKAFNKRSEELKESNKSRTSGMALARSRDTSDDNVIEGFGRKGKGLTNKIVKHLDKDNKEMIKLHRAFQKHMDTEEATK